MNNSATEQLLSAVNDAKENVERAEYVFNSRSRELRHKTKTTIDLFGGSAVNQVADIASDAKNACDGLYAAYQTQIQILDNLCRPLLDDSPSYRAVKEVTDLIIWLNKESEIENNYAASLNQHNLGTVVAARYIPTMENKMIQSFWESKCFSWPNRAEEEQKIEEEKRAAAEEKKRRAQAAHKAWGDEMQKHFPGLTRSAIAELYLKQVICDTLYDIDSGSVVDIINHSEELEGLSSVYVRRIINGMVGTYVERDGSTNYILKTDYEPICFPVYDAPIGTAAALLEYEKNIRMEAEKQEELEKQSRQEIYAQHRAEVDRMIDAASAAFHNAVTSAAEAAKSKSAELIDKKVEGLQKEKTALIAKKSSLGLLQFSEKSQITQQIQALDKQLRELASAAAVQNLYSEIDAKADLALKGYQNTLTEYLNNRFPYTAALKKAEEQLLERGTVNERIMYAVYKRPGISVAAIGNSDPVLAELSNQKLSSAIRRMVDMDLTRDDSGGPVIFTLRSEETAERLFRPYVPKDIDQYAESAEYVNMPIPQPPEAGALFRDI